MFIMNSSNPQKQCDNFLTTIQVFQEIAHLFTIVL